MFLSKEALDTVEREMTSLRILFGYEAPEMMPGEVMDMLQARFVKQHEGFPFVLEPKQTFSAGVELGFFLAKQGYSLALEPEPLTESIQ